MTESDFATTCLCEDHVQEALPHVVDDGTAARLSRIFRALSDSTRVRIVSLLVGAELCVGDLATALEMSQSAVSHQLRLLHDLGLVRRRLEGRRIFYTLDDQHVADLFQLTLDHVSHK